MQAGECQVVLTLFRAWNLPKTDPFSKIDPYFKVKFFATKQRSTKFDDNDRPEFNQTFQLNARVGVDGGPEGTVYLELWDENTFKDTHVGTATFNLQDYTPQQLAYLELPITLNGSLAKKPCGSTVAVGVTGAVLSYAALRSVLSMYPGTLFNDVQQKVYVPVPGTDNVMYVGIEYEGTVVDVKVYATARDVPVQIDMSLPTRAKTKVLRRTYPGGRVLVQNLCAYEEVKLDDVQLGELPNVQILLFRKDPLWQVSANKVATAHDWRGALTFDSACRTLSNIDMDKQEEEIYLSIEESNREALLLVDWDKDDVDIKVGVLALPTTGMKAFDLTIRNKDVKKKSDLYTQPRMKCAGKYYFNRILQLDDVPFGTALEDIMIYCSALSDPRVLPLLSFVPMVPVKRPPAQAQAHGAPAAAPTAAALGK